MCVKLISLFDRETKVCYVTQVLKQAINTKTMYPNYIHEIRNTKSHLLQVYVWGVDRYRNCHRNSCLLNCWSLLI